MIIIGNYGEHIWVWSRCVCQKGCNSIDVKGCSKCSILSWR